MRLERWMYYDEYKNTGGKNMIHFSAQRICPFEWIVHDKRECDNDGI
jgi:hypothetical protein